MKNDIVARVQVDLDSEAAWLYHYIARRKKTEAIKMALLLMAENEEIITKFIVSAR